MKRNLFALAALCALAPVEAKAVCPHDVNCLNNPYGGRDATAPPFNASPYGWGQLGAAFGANPLRAGATQNPYAPVVRPDEDAQPRNAAPAPGGPGVGSPATPEGLQGLDPDRPK